VDTPSAVAIDLGCAYTLQVAAMVPAPFAPRSAGSAFISTGATLSSPPALCAPRRPETRPGTPYFETSTPAFREASRNSIQPQNFSIPAAIALVKILSERVHGCLAPMASSPRHHRPRKRAQVYALFAALVPRPKDHSQRSLNLDQSMLDLWWNSLGLAKFPSGASGNNRLAATVPISQKLLQKKQSLLKQTP